MASKRKKLTRSKQDKILAGVIAGVGEYFDLDATLLRVVWLIAVAFSGFIPGILVYVVAAMIVPSK